MKAMVVLFQPSDTVVEGGGWFNSSNVKSPWPAVALTVAGRNRDHHDGEHPTHGVTLAVRRVARDIESAYLLRKPDEVDPIAHPWFFRAEGNGFEGRQRDGVVGLSFQDRLESLA